MNLLLYDPLPIRHDYVAKMFFEPMLRYARQRGIGMQNILNGDIAHTIERDALLQVKNSTVIALADNLTPELIRQLKENGNKIVAFNCTDSSFVSSSLRLTPELELIDRIFLVSGIQRTQFSNELVIGSNFELSIEPKKFMEDGEWAVWDAMRKRGVFESLPYVSWEPLQNHGGHGYGQRRQKIQFRGGQHFLRVLAYLMANARGLADPASAFLAFHYFADNMDPRYRFCDECRNRWKGYHGKYPYLHAHARGNCNSPAKWGGSMSDFDMSNRGAWDNRCPQSFYWLADRFAEKHGKIDTFALEMAMNGKFMPGRDHLNHVGQTLFSGDFKLIFSIYQPQRFWEVAAMGAINLNAARCADQDTFPALVPGVHYLTFSEDLSNFPSTVDEATYKNVTGAARALYEQWIRPTEFGINTNLLKHIFERIEAIQ